MHMPRLSLSRLKSWRWEGLCKLRAWVHFFRRVGVGSRGVFAQFLWSAGCPPLCREAYNGATLREQWVEQSGWAEAWCASHSCCFLSLYPVSFSKRCKFRDREQSAQRWVLTKHTSEVAHIWRQVQVQISHFPQCHEGTQVLECLQRHTNQGKIPQVGQLGRVDS